MILVRRKRRRREKRRSRRRRRRRRRRKRRRSRRRRRRRRRRRLFSRCSWIFRGSPNSPGTISTSTHERLRANSTYQSAALSQDVQYTAGTRARDLYKKQPQNSQCPFTEDADASKSLCRLPSGIIGCVRHDNQILHT